MKMSGMGMLVWILLFVGGLNWGLVGFFDYNLVSSIFGDGTFTKVIYMLVGVAALWSLISMFTGGSKTASSSGMMDQKPM